MLINFPEYPNKPDYFYWRPPNPLSVSPRERGHVGRLVTVTKWGYAFEPAGFATGEARRFGAVPNEPLWKAIWFGWVQELNKYIPEGELRG